MLVPRLFLSAGSRIRYDPTVYWISGYIRMAEELENQGVHRAGYVPENRIFPHPKFSQGACS